MKKEGRKRNEQEGNSFIKLHFAKEDRWGGKDSMNIIRQIYNGDYRPADQEPEETPEHQAARERAYREYQALRDKLPMEQRTELDQLIDAHLEASLYGYEAAYTQGARAGAQLLLDLLDGCR